MKKVMVLTAALLMSGLAGALAQSGQPKAKPAGAPQKPDMSQVQGKGVPYNKAPQKADHNVPNPGVGTGPDAKATGQFSPGSHTAQREHKIGRKTKRIDPVQKSDKPNQ